MKTSEFRTRLNKLRGAQTKVESELRACKGRIREQRRNLFYHERAREIVKTVALATQEQLTFHISDVATLALEAVFNDPYKLQVEFIQRRNKTECDLFFTRDDTRMDPLDASGGGAVDVAAFALRIASWSMARPRSRNVIVLDEPLRFLSEDNQERASQMIKELSEKLGLQFIIVTHNETLTAYADRVFEVKIRKGISKVTQL